MVTTEKYRKVDPISPFDSVEFETYGILSCNPFGRVVANALHSPYGVMDSTLPLRRRNLGSNPNVAINENIFIGDIVFW